MINSVCDIVCLTSLGLVRAVFRMSPFTRWGGSALPGDSLCFSVAKWATVASCCCCSLVRAAGWCSTLIAWFLPTAPAGAFLCFLYFTCERTGWASKGNVLMVFKGRPHSLCKDCRPPRNSCLQASYLLSQLQFFLVLVQSWQEGQKAKSEVDLFFHKFFQLVR